MKTNYLSIIIVFIFLIKDANGQSPNWLWAKAMGGAGSNGAYSIVHDNSGNIYTTGNYSGTVDFDPGLGVYNLTSTGNSNIYISKLDGSGNFIWAKATSGTSASWGFSIALDSSGNVFITGFFNGTIDLDPDSNSTFNLTSAGLQDIFILKLNSSGNFVWAKSMGGSGFDVGNSISTDAFGNVYTTGLFTGTTDFDPGVGTFNLISSGIGDIFISKLDDAGTFAWAKSIGGASTDYGNSITIDAFANVYFTGIFKGTVDFDPSAASFNLTSTGDGDIFISKLNSSGNFQWAKALVGSDPCCPNESSCIAIDTSNNVYTTGRFGFTVDFDPGIGTFNITSSGSGDIFICKLSSSGNFVWAKSMGGTESDIGHSIAVDASGNVYTTGSFNTTADFDPGVGIFNLTSSGYDDGFISKLDGSGNFLWAKAMNGIFFDGGSSLTIDSSGSVYVTGDFSSPSITFDSFNLLNVDSNNNTSDLFIAKLGNVTGIRSMENIKDISLYPNPFTSQISITIQKQNIKQVTFTIKNILGQTIFSKQENNLSNTYTKTIDLSFHAKGIYLLDVNIDGERTVKKIVKR